MVAAVRAVGEWGAGHDTLARVSARGFASWVRACAEVSEGEVIALDGKTSRRSYGRSVDSSAHLRAQEVRVSLHKFSRVPGV